MYVYVYIEVKLPHFEALENSEAEVEEDGEEKCPPGQNIFWSLTIKRSFNQTKGNWSQRIPF